jgi:hypothetical protein
VYGVECVGQGDGRDQQAGDDAQPAGTVVDTARVGDHQDQQQPDADDRVGLRLADRSDLAGKVMWSISAVRTAAAIAQPVGGRRLGGRRTGCLALRVSHEGILSAYTDNVSI